jgi:hypothetical protein
MISFGRRRLREMSRGGCASTGLRELSAALSHLMGEGWGEGDFQFCRRGPWSREGPLPVKVNLRSISPGSFACAKWNNGVDTNGAVRLAPFQSAARNNKAKRWSRKQPTTDEKTHMKMSQLAVAVAVAGLFGVSARASSLPDGYSSVKIKATALIQAADTTTSSSIKYSTMKVKITNKEMLNLIASTWDISLGDGAQLVLNNVWSGRFSVLNKDGAVIISNASSYDDSYWELYTSVQSNVYSGKDSSSSETRKYDAIAYLYWEDEFDDNYFQIYGPSTIDGSWKSSGSKESFKINGGGNGYWDGDYAVVEGSVSGKGKNNLRE